jgi:hypothetical protein
MTTHDFNNHSDQAERKQVLEDTLFSRQQNIIDDAGGRYARITLDEVSGPEPPLEIDIEFVGELGGASPALPCAEAATLARGGSSLTSDDPPQLSSEQEE